MFNFLKKNDDQKTNIKMKLSSVSIYNMELKTYNLEKTQEKMSMAYFIRFVFKDG